MTTLIKKSYSNFIEIVNSRRLEIQLTQDRFDIYHLIAKDGIVFYECHISKDTPEALDFETHHLADTKNKFTQTETVIEWDEIVTSFPANHEDLFTYYRGGVAVQTVLVTYESASKKTVMNIKKTRL